MVLLLGNMSNITNLLYKINLYTPEKYKAKVTTTTEFSVYGGLFGDNDYNEVENEEPDTKVFPDTKSNSPHYFLLNISVTIGVSHNSS